MRGPRRSLCAALVSLGAVIFGAGAGPIQAQTAPTYTITSVTPAKVPAGAAGAILGLAGTLPDFSLGVYQVCFFTGSGSAPLTPTLVNNVPTITVPAATIQSIPAGSFTAANGYTVSSLVSVVPAGQTCDGTVDPTLTNTFPVPVVEPAIGTYTGPASIPQTNGSTGVQAAPTFITLSGSNFVTGTTVTFGSFGNVTPATLTSSVLSVAVPAAFSSSPPGTTATLTVCNAGATPAAFCSAPAAPITLTITPLATSVGTVTAAPSPALASDRQVLKGQFGKSTGDSTFPGAPSGTVTFVVPGVDVPGANLILDPTATFHQTSSALAVPVAAVPTITPAAGNYLNSAMVAITDATPGAAIYYTNDGSTPTTASALYTGPFSITATQTITAIAAASGFLNSASASAAYTITISPPTQLVFQVQPVTTAINTAITPAVQVAIEDANGNVVSSSTLPVTLSLNENPYQGTLAGTATVNAVNGIATFSNLTVNNVGDGYSVQARSGSLTTAYSARFNITPYPITMTVQSELVGIGSTLTGSFALSHPAPAGGVVVTLASSVTANVTISPATVTVAAGQSSGTFTYTGVAAGDSNLTASATNYLTGTVRVTGTAAQVSLGTIPAVAPGQTVSLALSLPMPAPPGGTTVTFTSSNTAIATVTSSIFIPAGAQTGTANPQIVGVRIGTTTIVASAPGYAPDSRAVNVTVVSNFNPTSTSINLATTTSTTLNISAPAQVGGLTFTLTSDNPAVATVPATISMVQGTTSVQVPITGVANGTTTIRANSPGVAETTMSVNVNSNIAVSSTFTAYHLQYYTDLYLPVTPQSPITVTVTLPDTSTALITSSSTAVGTKTVTFNNVTSYSIGRIYLQGVAPGATTLTVSAPGFTTGSAALTVYRSGFSFYGFSNSFPTTTFAATTSVNVTTVALNPDLTVAYYDFPLAPGVGPVSVPITSSVTTVGTLNPTTLVFNPGNTYLGSAFTPVGAGMTNLTIGAVAGGFSTPSQAQYQQITATVTSPQIAVSATLTGVNVEYFTDLYLPVSPPTAETVTVSSSAAGLVTIAKDSVTAGSASLTFTVAANTNYIGRVWLQGHASGTAALNVSAPGYLDGSGQVTIDKTGFSFYGSSNSFSTTTFSSPTNVNLSTVLINSTSGNIERYGFPINPGLSVTVPLTNSNSGAGTIASSVVFNATDSSDGTNFTPVAAGSSTISIGTAPAGFVTPSQTQYQQIVATVTAPALTVSNLTVGEKLQNYFAVNVPQPPAAGATVTVTTSAPGTATLSKTNTDAGSTSLSFTVTYATTLYIYAQGQTAGSATVTASATGYTAGTGTVTVGKSGFSIYGANSSTFTTTTFSGKSAISVATNVLDPTTLNIVTTGLTLNPGVTASVPLTDSNPEVGTLGTNLLMVSGAGSGSTTFQPVSAGMTTIGIGTPVGFSTPAQSQYLQVVGTVTAPQLQVGSITTGVNLEGGIRVYLPVTPPGMVDVVVTSNGPAIATISSDGTVVGGTVLTFPGVTSAGYLPTIYVQGQQVGSTTITASAAGYTNGVGTATVHQSGFSFYAYTGNFTTSTTSTPTTITVSADVLSLGTLTVEGNIYQLNPGIGPITVPVTSGTPSVGTISGSVVFNAGDSTARTTFVPLSTGSTVLTVGTPTNATGTPTGFSTPSQSQYTTITGTVQ